MDIKKKKGFVLDMDGTLYLGNKLISGAKEFLELLLKTDRMFLLLTNNSSKSKTDYRRKLKSLGIEVEEKSIFTSGEATCIFLKGEDNGENIFLLGTKELEDEFKDYGFNIINDTEEYPNYVVLGFDTTLDYKKVWRACDYIREGVPFIATHPDINCPLDEGRFMPDCGAMIEMIKASTGVKPKVIGKPNEEIIQGIFEKTGLKKEDLCIVGDRLYTDIATGINSGITSVLVLTGETKNEDLGESSIKPDIVIESIEELYNMLK